MCVYVRIYIQAYTYILREFMCDSIQDLPLDISRESIYMVKSHEKSCTSRSITFSVVAIDKWSRLIAHLTRPAQTCAIVQVIPSPGTVFISYNLDTHAH